MRIKLKFKWMFLFVAFGILGGCSYTGPEHEVDVKLKLSSSIVEKKSASSVENGPRTNSVENGPRTNSVENGPRTNSVENGPRTNSVENGPRTYSVENIPRTNSVENEPRTYLAPQSALAHDCYFLNASGSGVMASYEAFTQGLTSSCMGFGTVSDVVDLDTLNEEDLSLRVKAGTQRTVQLLGVDGVNRTRTGTSGCGGYRSLYDVIFFYMPRIHVLGTDVRDLFNDTEISLRNSYRRANATDLLAPCIVSQTGYAEIDVRDAQDRYIAAGAGRYNFGNITCDSFVTGSITIRNTGGNTLSLTAVAPNLVTLSGTDSSYFSIFTQPASSVLAGQSTSFQIQFSPRSGGEASFSVSVAISNNDPDESSFIFSVVGTCGGSIKDRMVFAVQPSSVATAGIALTTQPVVQVQDAQGQVVSSAMDRITLSAFTDASCTTAASGTFSAPSSPLVATGGQAPFSGVTYNRAETIYLKASASGLSSVCSTGITVAPAGASQLVFSTEPPSSTTANVNFNPAPEVQIRDQYSNFINTATNSITLSAHVDSNCGTAAGTLNAAQNPVIATGGVATFSINYSLSGTIYLKALANSLTPVCSRAVAVLAGSATKLAFSTAPATSGVAGIAFSPQPVIHVQDVNGNLITSATDTVTITAYTNSDCTTAASGTSDNNSMAAVAGVAAFTNLSYNKAESVYLKASSATGLTSLCSAVAVSVSAGTSSKLAFSTEPSSSATAGASFSPITAVQVQDAFGNVVFTATNNVTLTAYTNNLCTNSATSSLNNGSTLAASGTAYFSTLSYNTAETIYIKASATGLTAVCSTVSVTVSAGTKTKLYFSTQPPSSAIAGTAFSTQPVVKVYDTYDNLVSSASDQVTLIAYTDASCSISAGGLLSNASVNASSGMATFTASNFDTAGTIYIKAYATGLTPVCSTAVSVSAGTASQVLFTTAPPTSATAGIAFSPAPVVKIFDAYNNVVTTETRTVTISSHSISDCTGSTSGSLSNNSMSAVAGVAGFSAISYNNYPETIYLKASASGLTPNCSSTPIVMQGSH